MILPLDLLRSNDKSDPAVSFAEAVKEVNFNKYINPITSNNTHSHSIIMVLKVLLFAYQENERSLSKIEKLCRTDIRYMWLSNEERPSK